MQVVGRCDAEYLNRWIFDYFAPVRCVSLEPELFGAFSSELCHLVRHHFEGRFEIALTKEVLSNPPVSNGVLTTHESHSNDPNPNGCGHRPPVLPYLSASQWF